MPAIFLIDDGEDDTEISQLALEQIAMKVECVTTFTDLATANFDNRPLLIRIWKKIESSVFQMSSLIKSILSYFPIRTSNRAFGEVNVGDIVEVVKDDFELMIEGKQAIIKYHDLPSINGNPFQLHQLSSNLISSPLSIIALLV